MVVVLPGTLGRVANEDGCSQSLEVVTPLPEVFVLELAPEEVARLKSISKHAKYG